MNTLRAQKGASMFSWMLIICMVGIIGLAGLKLMPHYMEYYTIASVLEDMQTEPSLKGANKKKIYTYFYKRMTVNGIRTIRKEQLSVTKVQGKKIYLIEVNYEIKEPLFANLSIMANFSRSAEVGGG